MIVKYFSDNDIKNIDNNIDNIMKKAEIKKYLNATPTIDYYKDVMKHVLDFVKDKKRIIYGGTAWDMLINKMNKKDKIYDEYTKHDLDFYSYEPIKDLKELCDKLHKLGYQYIQGKNAFHSESYKIYVNFDEYCNITYMPKYIFTKIDKMIVDNYYLIGNRVILIDLLRQYNDPINSLWRLNKTFKRGNKIMKYYPLKLNTNGKDLNKLYNKQRDIANLIFNYITTDYKNFIFVDRNAIEVYINSNKNLSSNNVKFNDYPIEVITNNLNKKTREIYDFLLLNNIELDKIKVEENYKFFQFLDRKIIFKYDEQIILTIYNDNQYCIPYNLINIHNNIKQIMIGTFNVCFLYLLINLLYTKINNEDYKTYELIMSKMIKARDKFLIDTKMSILDNNIYQDFKMDCFGTIQDGVYKYFLKSNEKSNYSRSKIPNYDPSNEKNYLFNPDDYYFDNCSGYINNNFNIDDLND